MILINIDANNLKEVYVSSVKVKKDERFYSVPNANDYVFSTYCRLLKQTNNNYYKVVPLIDGNYVIKFDNESEPRKIRVNRLAAMVFFPEVKNGFMYSFDEVDGSKNLQVENLHLLEGKDDIVEAFFAKAERRQPTYSADKQHHQFINRMDLNGKSITSKLNSLYRNMRSRATNKKVKKRQPLYQNTTICKEWLDNPSAFKEFILDNQYYYNGKLEVDKDILGLGQSNIYSPQSVALVPKYINDIFTTSPSKLCYSIKKSKRKDGSIVYSIPPNAFNLNNSNIKNLTFDNYIDALLAGRQRKANYIDEVVKKERAKGYMPEYILEAMTKWANLCRLGLIKKWEPSEEVLKSEGVM